ncbi:DUF2235 domain-containing protein [Duganella callida]|uniref:DUF2235 domain-containing protein n=1 Tax=Duganella callida TaxID=2561932 RepID=A0A4Y9SHN7_9BURK|nr:DUF2235 domain-containing protein [Duganella callida]TFW24672.1 DUF2235 domain-containing protein [Duganella callida]
MSKNIVFCADGTWNGPGQDLEGNAVTCSPTNVLKLYHWLDGKDTLETLGLPGEAERILRGADGAVTQVAKYLDGVGYADNWLVRILGGVFGSGIIARIVRGYTFISRYYEDGDRIFIIGFSRGAYTARSLAGMILDVGLLADQDQLADKETAYRLGCAMWNQHRKHPRMEAARHDVFGSMRDLLVDLPNFFSSPAPDSKVVHVPGIEAVAVWDTVGALGIPQYNRLGDRLDAFKFCNNRLDARIRLGLHAIADDEERQDFDPTLWDTADNVLQRRFRGAHGDVGGGYSLTVDGSGLSDIALLWMQRQLSEKLLFGSRPEGIHPDPTIRIHEPWKEVPFCSLGVARRDFRHRPDIPFADG